MQTKNIAQCLLCLRNINVSTAVHKIKITAKIQRAINHNSLCGEQPVRVNNWTNRMSTGHRLETCAISCCSEREFLSS